MSARLSDEQVAVLAEEKYRSAAWRTNGELAAHALAREVQERREVEAELRGALVWHRHSGDLSVLVRVHVEAEDCATVSATIFVPPVVGT